MLEAYLTKPGTLNDATGIPQGDFIQGVIKAVNTSNGECEVYSRTGRFSALPAAWRLVHVNVDRGDMWLDAKPGEMHRGTGRFSVQIPADFAGREVYFSPHPTKRKNKLGAPIKIRSIVLLNEYMEARAKLISELGSRKRAFENSSIYEVELLHRQNGTPKCDPLQKCFVTPVVESRDKVFRGSDVNAMRSVVLRYWPSTWAREIVVYNLGKDGTTRGPCEVAPWDGELKLLRVDRLTMAVPVSKT